MLDHYEAKLRWVLVDGEPHNVSDFAHLAPKDRPQAFCPVCGGDVVLKLGKVRVHHCAHPPESNCAATQPETIIHLNTKLYIYRQLQQTTKLTVIKECTDGRHITPTTQLFLLDRAPRLSCQKNRKHIWLQDWDRVEVEYRVGSRRPDIALLSKGKAVGAIEVFVSHAVDDEKAAYLRELDIPWLEVIGQESFYTAETAWTSDEPLPIYRMQPKKWVCDNCIKIQKIEQEFRNTEIKVHAARLVDLYWPSGKKYRAVYLAVKMIKDGECVEIRLQDSKDNVIAREFAPITPLSMKNLTEKFNNFLDGKERTGAIWDSPMVWDQNTLLKTYESGNYLDKNLYPYRYQWRGTQEEWWMPEYFETISWDR